MSIIDLYSHIFELMINTFKYIISSFILFNCNIYYLLWTNSQISKYLKLKSLSPSHPNPSSISHFLPESILDILLSWTWAIIIHTCQCLCLLSCLKLTTHMVYHLKLRSLRSMKNFKTMMELLNKNNPETESLLYSPLIFYHHNMFKTLFSLSSNKEFKCFLTDNTYRVLIPIEWT